MRKLEGECSLDCRDRKLSSTHTLEENIGGTGKAAVKLAISWTCLDKALQYLHATEGHHTFPAMFCGYGIELLDKRDGMRILTKIIFILKKLQSLTLYKIRNITQVSLLLYCTHLNHRHERGWQELLEPSCTGDASPAFPSRPTWPGPAAVRSHAPHGSHYSLGGHVAEVMGIRQLDG